MRAEARAVTTSAPGKLILMGEHSVVYGRPALVAAIGLRTRVRAARRAGDGVALDLPDLGVRREVGWDEIGARARRASEAWERYREDPGPETIRAVLGGDPAALVMVALGEAVADLEDRRPPGIALRVASEIPVGSGFGSSAAIAVAVPAAVLALFDRPAGATRLDRLATRVERRQHGQPSGADHGAVLRGGIVRVEPAAAGARLEPVPAGGGLLSRLEVLHAGTPAETTGEVVAAVRRRRSAAPRRFEALLLRMGAAVAALEQELVREVEDPARVAAAVGDFEGALEALGVVPRAIRRRIRRLEARGAAAKISGAGALSGDGAGSLLLYRPPAAGSLDAELAGLEPLAVRLGAEGLRYEEAA